MGVIELDGLSKHYGDVRANDDVTFAVDEGEIFGYLGPNGAGKTTTIRLLLGLIKPTDGSATVFGTDIRDRRALTETKARIGYLPDELGFEERLTGRAVLDHFARMRGDERREELLELFHPPLDRKVEEYSHGNKRMLGIVNAFMHDPDLVIMDEPTSGLDPLKQDRLHQFLEDERDDGTTIFFSSHVLSEVQRMCDRVGIIRDGELVALEDVDALIEQGGKDVWVHLNETVDDAAFATPAMIDVEVTDSSVQFTYTGDYNDLLSHLTAFDVADIVIANPQLDDIFKHYYGNDADAGDRDGDDRESDDSDAYDSDADDRDVVDHVDESDDDHHGTDDRDVDHPIADERKAGIATEIDGSDTDEMGHGSDSHTEG